MITIINTDIARPRRRPPPLAFVLAFVLALVSAILAGPSGLGSMARADAGPAAMTSRAVLTEFFPRSERVTFQIVTVDAALRERLTRRLGYAPAAERYTVFVATTGATVDGYAVIDDQLGEHQPITFATKLSPLAVIELVEVVAYREPRGDEVRDARFRRQFVGKTGHDPLRLGRDIDAVTGATISSASMAVAVRRAAVLVEETMVGRTKVASRANSSGSPPPPSIH